MSQQGRCHSADMRLGLSFGLVVLVVVGQAVQGGRGSRAGVLPLRLLQERGTATATAMHHRHRRHKTGEGHILTSGSCAAAAVVVQLSFRPIKSTHEYPPVLSGGLPMTMSQLFTLEPALAPNEVRQAVKQEGR